MSRPTLERRSGGLLLHVTSLPGPHGVGDLGPEAYRFVDFLVESGLSWWQMLPVGPAGGGNSPYSSPSALAGEPLLLSLELLVSDGLLSKADLAESPVFPRDRVDFAAARRYKEPLLRKACAGLKSGTVGRFLQANGWVSAASQFLALEAKHAGRDWPDWPEGARHPERYHDFASELKEVVLEVKYQALIQHLFARQWARLRAYAAERGVGLIGDVPIYPALQSADVWSHQGCFQLDAEGRPEAVAGVPPDYFSKDGQLWGNPLFRWDREETLDWWIERLGSAAARFDVVRLDHFIGFHNYWAVPAGAKTAKEGRWLPGPGPALFERVRRELPGLELIAEDLGVVTPGVEALRDLCGLPGMRVGQFSFSSGAEALPRGYPVRSVAYTGTHDNDTARGWLDNPGPRAPDKFRAEREAALRHLGCGAEGFPPALLRAVFKSPAATAIAPVQDLLGLGAEARMNTPGTETGNWEWRLAPGALTPELAAGMRALVRECAR